MTADCHSPTWGRMVQTGLKTNFPRGYSAISKRATFYICIYICKRVHFTYVNVTTFTYVRDRAGGSGSRVVPTFFGKYETCGKLGNMWPAGNTLISQVTYFPNFLGNTRGVQNLGRCKTWDKGRLIPIIVQYRDGFLTILHLFSSNTL